jgi:hypothetical protein
MKSLKSETELSTARADRRAFLATAGKLAVGVPPSLVTLLSTSMSSSAIAASGGGSGNNGGNDNDQGENDNDQGDNDNQ